MKLSIVLLSCLVVLAVMLAVSEAKQVAVLSENEEVALESGRLVGILDRWGPEFFVSFDVKATSFINKWQSVIYFTIDDIDQKNSDLGVYGCRIPAVYIAKSTGTTSHLMFASAINGNPNEYYIDVNNDISVGEWNNIEIAQTHDGDVTYSFEVKLNGQSVYTSTNTQAQEFSNVRVYAGSPDSRTPALNGVTRRINARESRIPDVQDGIKARGAKFGDVTIEESKEACYARCLNTEGCTFWTWYYPSSRLAKRCSVYEGEITESRTNKHAISGIISLDPPGTTRCISWTHTDCTGREKEMSCNLGVYETRQWKVSLQEAQDSCRMKSDCFGITKDNGGYEPRSGTTPYSNGAAHELWICDA